MEQSKFIEFSRMFFNYMKDYTEQWLTAGTVSIVFLTFAISIHSCGTTDAENSLIKHTNTQTTLQQLTISCQENCPSGFRTEMVDEAVTCYCISEAQ